MAKLSRHERAEIENLFKLDLAKIQASMRERLEEYWSAVQGSIVDEVGIKDKMADAIRLEKEIEELKAKLARIREEMQHEIIVNERRLADIRATAVGVYSGPPTQEQLKELGLYDHDASIKDRIWYGFPIRSRLDAETAIRLRSSADISKPIRALEGIAGAVAREMAFASTHEAAYEAYKKFHNLGFRQMGVDLPPLLEDIKAMRGETLLEAQLVETSTRLLDGETQKLRLIDGGGKPKEDGPVPKDEE